MLFSRETRPEGPLELELSGLERALETETATLSASLLTFFGSSWRMSRTLKPMEALLNEFFSSRALAEEETDVFDDILESDTFTYHTYT